MSKWIKVAAFMSRMEADIAKLLLENNGISTQLRTDDLGGLQPALTLTSGVDLWVPQEDVHDALRLLNTTPPKLAGDEF